MHEQVLHLPGDPDRPADLVVTLYMPDGPGPFPLAVMNHGSSGNASDHAAAPRYRFTMSAYYFLSRGYAVALPMMRGFAGSGGEQERYGCELDKMAMDNGNDIAAVINDLSNDPRIDPQRVVVAGQSFGGWNTLGLGALQPHHVRGLVNFVGGVQSSACGGFEDGGHALVQAAGRLGNYTLLPSIWFYGDNDSLFGPDVWGPMREAYAAHGASVELVDVGSFMEDSHQMLSRPESIPLWAPKLDAFLARIGMPSRAVYPQYMPLAWPKPTNFATIDNVAALPWVNDKGRENYRKFLTLPLPRAFLVGVGGQAVSTQGGFDPLGRAEKLCRDAHFTCVPYALDNDVVFVAPSAAPAVAATHFAAIDDVAAVPWVNDKGREAYRAFLSHAPPKAFVVGTGGEFLSIVSGADPLQKAMSICANAHIECRAYAVDNDVVWVKPPPPPKGPPASGFAALDNVSAVPWLNEKTRALYAHFLTVPLPRAFAIAPGGQVAATQGGYDPLGRALGKCRAAGFTCLAYAVDDRVVWAPGR